MAIITISREMGSGGIPIAVEAAQKLGYALIDGDSIREVAGEYGLTEEAIEQADEKPPAFVDALDDQLAVDLHQIELIILEKALQGNVIIYGRGGQDLLKQVANVFRVRIIAPFEERVERWAEREWLDPDYARILVRRSDQQRAGFIKYYFDRDWEDPLDYDLVINTSRLSHEMAVKMICDGVMDSNLVERKGASKKILSNLILQKKAEIALAADKEIDTLHTELTAAEGVITFTGHMHSREERTRALQIIEAIDGVTEIIDRTKIIQYRNFPDEH
ncbi:cytidylate kinase family protein [Geothermobacter hydrogeniphilus]|uniref:Transport-associated protein n=1 Tax=Geothermobacter hydrogeniphilus TaxID=1969733 RepID=A0A1X0Y5L1_9BACT|nr:cytidylate kinase family protein [Geothermobacter hydrogeniphilus]ORJ60433.1 transport-associated protein [Geothermobacter hydrogeniphilus]